jgi:hypothetical protein
MEAMAPWGDERHTFVNAYTDDGSPRRARDPATFRAGRSEELSKSGTKLDP